MRNYTSDLPRAMLRLILDTYRYVRFQSSECRGVYRSLEQAEAAAPRGKKIGYNHEELAKGYLGELNLSLSSHRYPILYHLGTILRNLPERCTLLDFGGNVGVHYLSLQKYLDLDKVKWSVCDVPAIIKIGQESCTGISNVLFIDDITKFTEPDLDVFLASGSMQYIKSPDILLLKLMTSGVRPRHVLIDDVPVYDGPRFVTLQNGGLVCYAQYIFNREEFIKAITDFGYKVINCWHHYTYIIPFHHEKVISCEGYYFAR
jgi:putative methyltransferase (TIGR04325 family)